MIARVVGVVARISSREVPEFLQRRDSRAVVDRYSWATFVRLRIEKVSPAGAREKISARAEFHCGGKLACRRGDRIAFKTTLSRENVGQQSFDMVDVEILE